MSHFTPLVDWRSKGLPGRGEAISPAEIADAGWNVLRGDMPTPVALLRSAAIEHNRLWMQRFLEATGTLIAPHGKTTMSPELIAMQIADGAWGMTAATAHHLRIYRRLGLSRIILANQLISPADIDIVLDELAAAPDLELYSLADSIEGVERLEQALVSRSVEKPLKLLVELGAEGGRTGCRTNEGAIRLARRIAASPTLQLSGIETYEGIFRDAGDGEGEVVRLLDRVVELARLCCEEGLFPDIPILTAGGSAYFDLATRMAEQAGLYRWTTVLRSGCYIVHDSHSYRDALDRLLARSPTAASLGDGLRPALELWTCVQSRPESGRVIAALGKRDTSFDAGMPVAQWWARIGRDAEPRPLSADHRCVRLDDQHAYLDVPETSPLEVGDLIGFGISHPCTTFDKWRVLFEVNERYDVTGAVHTIF